MLHGFHRRHGAGRPGFSCRVPAAFRRITIMSDPPPGRIALFIDGANLHATARTLGFDMDYRRLLVEFSGRGAVLRAFYYTTTLEDLEFSSVRPLLDWLDYNGYSVVTRPAKEFADASGRRKLKGSISIDLAIDAMDIAP